ncbi:hypothetical protein [Glycomyces sp. NPDC048151]|uniref:hypothetical protein n=1 Tax=Glycomyces sp. NPDC048151 TaxID=3364002 RepID=UPI0037121117
MPTTADPTATDLGVLHAFGYDLHVTYDETENGTRRFAIRSLGGSVSDTPLGEVGLTRGGMLYPGLNADAKRLGFGLAGAGGPVLMRFLVEIAAALDGDGLDGEWDFTPDPRSLIPSDLPTRGTEAAAWAA